MGDREEYQPIKVDGVVDCPWMSGDLYSQAAAFVKVGPGLPGKMRLGQSQDYAHLSAPMRGPEASVCAMCFG